jgi:VWFA-related protein
MRNSLARLLTIAVLATSFAIAQTKPSDRAEQAPTFKANTELVLIPVVVMKGNAPVKDLKKENFTVEEDGKSRPITLFEVVTPATVAAHAKKREPGAREFSNVGVSGEVPQALTLIVIDGINTPAMNQEQARKQVLGFTAKNATAGQMLGVVLLTDKGVKLVQDFTVDPRALIAALEKVTGQNNRFNAGVKLGTEQQNVSQSSTPPVGVADPDTPGDVAASGRGSAVNLSQDSYDQNLQTLDSTLVNFIRASAKAQEYELAQVINSTLEGFQQIAQGLSVYPGKKNVIWLSAGFVYPLDMNQFQNQRYLVDQYTRTMKMLSDANVAVYPVDVHGIQFIAGADTTYTREDSWAGVDKYSSYKNASIRLDTFRDFAERTGGRVFFDPNDNSKAFEAILGDTRNYYMLGYYIDRKQVPTGWHKLKVKLNNADGHVQARSGFFVAAPVSDPEAIRKNDLMVASRAPFDYTGLTIEAAWLGETAAEGKKKKAEFRIHVLPDTNLIGGDDPSINIDFISVARKPNTDVAGQSSKSVSMKLQPKAVETITQEGISYKGSLLLDPGEYAVRFMVRDNLTGRIGTVEAPLKVQ